MVLKSILIFAFGLTLIASFSFLRNSSHSFRNPFGSILLTQKSNDNLYAKVRKLFGFQEEEKLEDLTVLNSQKYENFYSKVAKFFGFRGEQEHEKDSGPENRRNLHKFQSVNGNDAKSSGVVTQKIKGHSYFKEYFPTLVIGIWSGVAGAILGELISNIKARFSNSDSPRVIESSPEGNPILLGEFFTDNQDEQRAEIFDEFFDGCGEQREALREWLSPNPNRSLRDIQTNNQRNGRII